MAILLGIREKGQVVETIRILESATTEDGMTYASIDADELLRVAGAIQDSRSAIFEPAPRESLKTETSDATDTPATTGESEAAEPATGE